MKKYKMNDEEAKRLLKKLIDDTNAGNLDWESIAVNEEVHIKPEFEIPLTTAKADVHYVATIYATATAHFQYYGGLYYIWVQDGDEMARFSDKLFLGPTLIDMLVDLGKAIPASMDADGAQLKSYVDAYLGIE